MDTFAHLAQLIIALTIIIVWVARFDNIVKEFEHYRYSDLLRNVVGASKISLSTILVVGIWFPQLVLIPSLLMAFLMVCAQITHIRVRSPIFKYVPSFMLLSLSLFVAAVHANLI